MSTGLRILKFGSSVLERPEDYRAVAVEVRTEIEKGNKVVAVVSAMGGTTDELLAAVNAVTQTPPHALLVSLLATGEEASVALLSMALAAKGVRINSVNPGVTRTELHLAGGLDDDRYAAFVEHSKTTHPIGRIGKPEDISYAALDLASDESDFVAGETITPNGGVVIG